MHVEGELGSINIIPLMPMSSASSLDRKTGQPRGSKGDPQGWENIKKAPVKALFNDDADRLVQ